MAAETSTDDVPLPSNGPSTVKSAILQVISLARLAIVYIRSWAADSVSSRVRLRATRIRLGLKFHRDHLLRRLESRPL